MSSDLLLVAASLGTPVAVCAGHYARTRLSARRQGREAEHQRLTGWLEDLRAHTLRPVRVLRGDTGKLLRLVQIGEQPGRHRAQG